MYVYVYHQKIMDFRAVILLDVTMNIVKLSCDTIALPWTLSIFKDFNKLRM